jgi:phospholipid/cholesterol/gamma-HCH transport system substrate-binding protein
MGDLPIPGTGVSGDTMKVQADFRDALNLAQGAPVKVNGVDAGKVDSIGERNFTAEVTMTIRKDADLHRGATARLRYTTPLGELFVDVDNPKSGPLLTDGSKLSLDDTATAPTVEDALSEASLLINGGGLDQLQTVTQELNTALNGHEGDYRALLEKARTFLTQANATTGSVNRVLTSLDALSKTLNARKSTINRAVRQIRPAAHVLRQETPAFTKLLKSLDRFAGAANSTVNATRSQLLRMLSELQPVLAQFASTRPQWEASLASLVRAAGTLDNIVPGDYANISLRLHLDGIGATGLLGSVTNLLHLLGLDNLLNSKGTGLLNQLLGGLNLGGLGGKSPTGTHGGTGGTGGTGGKGGSTGGTSPVGVGQLLNNLLGGGR